MLNTALLKYISLIESNAIKVMVAEGHPKSVIPDLVTGILMSVTSRIPIAKYFSGDAAAEDSRRYRTYR